VCKVVSVNERLIVWVARAKKYVTLGFGSQNYGNGLPTVSIGYRLVVLFPAVKRNRKYTCELLEEVPEVMLRLTLNP
jgi:hypothetical protein